MSSWHVDIVFFFKIHRSCSFYLHSTIVYGSSTGTHTYTTSICIEKNVSHTVFPMHLKMCFNVYMRLPTSSSALLFSAMTSQMDILYNHNDDDPIQPTNLACNTECIAEYELFCRNDEPKTQWALLH